VVGEVPFVPQAAFDRVQPPLIELLALLAVLLGGDRLATHTVLDPRGYQLFDRVPADLDGNHRVIELLDDDAHPVGDTDVAVQAPGALPCALPSDAHEDQRDRVGHELTTTAR